MVTQVLNAIKNEHFVKETAIRLNEIKFAPKFKNVGYKLYVVHSLLMRSGTEYTAVSLDICIYLL